MSTEDKTKVNLVVFTGIPLPPSVNGQYATVMVGARPLRVPSKEYKNYKKLFAAWVMNHKSQILEARRLIMEWGTTLEFAMYCCFERSRLITKDGRCKSLDISNRSKALHDLMAEALQIDDSIFVSTPMEKVISKIDEEQVIVMLRPFEYRHSLEVVPGILENT